MDKQAVQSIPDRVHAADLIWDRPVSHPVEGSPIGNGRMGTLVWTTPDALQFQINRVDVFAVNRNAAGAHAPGATDYGGGCGWVTVSVGGEPFQAGPDFRQHLSLHDARCTVTGDGVTASCWVSAEDDVLVVTLTDVRERPRPVEVRLAMWCDPEVRHGAHVAAYSFRAIAGGSVVVRTFREADHYCSSAVAVGARDTLADLLPAEERARVLRLPAQHGTRHLLITSASSWEEQVEAGAVAARVLENTLRRPLAGIEAEHERWWRDFWDRTYVAARSPDGRAEQAARLRMLFLYHIAATSRGAYPPKWNGSVFLANGDTRDWGSQFWLWTTEMLYWPLLAADAADLGAPFFDMYRRQLPALETAARQRWNADGIFLPETVPFDGPAELPEDLVDGYRDVFLRGRSNATLPERLEACCQFDYHLSMLLSQTAEDHGGYSPIGHLASSGAELAVHAWWRYRYTGDSVWLRSHAYPLLRGVAEFYRSYCRQGEDGRYHIHGTNAHEDFWGVTDSIVDLAAMRGAVPLAIRAAEILGVDAELRQQWRAFLDQLAPYPMGHDSRAKALTGAAPADDAWAAGFKGAVDGSHNAEDVQLTPIFPFEDWTLETREPRMDDIARHTLEKAPQHAAVLNGASLSTAIRSPIAAVRAGRADDLPAILERYAAAFAPLKNGFSLFEGGGDPDAQAHSIEHLGLLTMTLQEALLQSVSPHPGEPEIISVFPAWPRSWDAEFRLLARGGFLVTARCIAGRVDCVEIVSRRGELCRFRNCWGQRCVLEAGEDAMRELEGDILTFATARGQTCRISPTCTAGGLA